MQDTLNGSIQIVNTITELKQRSFGPGITILSGGRTANLDGGGAIYQWDATSTATEDTTTYNVVKSDMNTTNQPGRWIKMFQRVIVYPGGYLVRIGDFKIWIATKNTSSAEAVFYLTEDNTANGTALFTTIITSIGKANGTASNANDAIIGYLKAQDAKSVTYGFARGNSSILSILGLTVLGLRDVPTNTPVAVIVFGM